MCIKLSPSIHHMKTWVNIVIIRVYNLSIISWQEQTISGKYLHWLTKLKLQSKNRHLTLQQHVILTLNRSVLTVSFMEAKYLKSISELFYCISLILNWTKYFIALNMVCQIIFLYKESYVCQLFLHSRFLT